MGGGAGAAGGGGGEALGAGTQEIPATGGPPPAPLAVLLALGAVALLGRRLGRGVVVR